MTTDNNYGIFFPEEQVPTSNTVLFKELNRALSGTLSYNLTDTRPSIVLSPKELADTYGLKTLYDYLRASNPSWQLFFWNYDTYGRSSKIFEGVETKSDDDASIDTVVTCFSDIPNKPVSKPNVVIDLSILKNCVVPLSIEERLALKQKYGVPDNKPVVVVSYAHETPEVTYLVEKLRDCVELYVVGTFSEEFTKNMAQFPQVHLVAERGILKDYYAMADAAINAVNLRADSSPLHNFVEATEGGPLFMVPARGYPQYGYRQLVERGVIRECQDFMDIAAQVKEYLENFSGNEGHRAKRAEHLAASRTKYLPVIAAALEYLLGKRESLPESGEQELGIKVKDNFIVISHPETNWGNGAIFEIQKNSLIMLPEKYMKSSLESLIPPQNFSHTNHLYFEKIIKEFGKEYPLPPTFKKANANPFEKQAAFAQNDPPFTGKDLLAEGDLADFVEMHQQAVGFGFYDIIDKPLPKSLKAPTEEDFINSFIIKEMVKPDIYSQIANPQIK